MGSTKPKSVKHLSLHFFWTLVGALSILVLALVVALEFIAYGGEKGRLFGFKILELSVQMVLVTVLGGVLVQAYIKWHSRASSINEYRKTTAEAIIREYSAVKKVRRLIRASCIQGPLKTGTDPWTDIPINAYDTHLSSIIDAQLALELVKRRLRLLGGGFNGSTELSNKAELMEKYLGKIIGEYEQHRQRELQHDPISLMNLDRLRAFIASKPDENPASDFNTFRKPFDEMMDLLENNGVWVAI